MSFKLIITVVGVIKTVAVIQAATKLKPIAWSFVNVHVDLVSFAIKMIVIFAELAAGEFIDYFEIVVRDNLGLCFRAKGTKLVEVIKA